MLSEAKLGWLAGILDGEGSVGISFVRKHEALLAAVQIAMTDKDTVMEVLSLVKQLGCVGSAYTYQERDPTKHKDAWYGRITRLVDIKILSAQMLPYAVTKKKHWGIIHEFVVKRLAKSTLCSDGRVARGGLPRPFTEDEISLAKELQVLNLRGAKSRKVKEYVEKSSHVSRVDAEGQ